MQLLINTRGTGINVRNRCFQISKEGTQRTVSPTRLSSIAIGNACTISAQAILLAVKNNIPLFFLNGNGNTEAQLWSPTLSNHTSIRRQQVYIAETTFATRKVLDWLILKVRFQIQLLQFLQNRLTAQQLKLESCINSLQKTIVQFNLHENSLLSECDNSIMGMEGAASRIYFENLSNCVPEEYTFSGRSRMPATNHFNCLLNYYYGMLYGITENALLSAGLDPNFGLLHADDYDTPALSFDFIEAFRPWADGCIMHLCLQHELKPEYFDKKGNGYWLNSAGKKILIPIFNTFLQAKIKIDNRLSTRFNTIYRMAQAFAAELMERSKNKRK